mmetsp:Transcript_209/g.607  ORF Transcript_209/g.607 Transcript_209/m.607 type:complete len:640 (-) Transcript_209:933-2852(-)
MQHSMQQVTLQNQMPRSATITSAAPRPAISSLKSNKHAASAIAPRQHLGDVAPRQKRGSVSATAAPNASSSGSMTLERGMEQLHEITHEPEAAINQESAAELGSSGSSKETGRGARAASSVEELGRDLNWRSEWFPAGFSKDMPEGQPMKVTLFDEDYAVVQRPASQGGPLALIDRCPHRAAALSQGVLTPGGNLQCAYHGWQFDAGGACKSIPQLPAEASLPKSTCATAFPAYEHEGVVFIKPTPLPRGQAYDFTNFDPAKEIHGVRGEDEMEGLVWSGIQFTRDFPIDYTLLLENVADPDHGMFAHQSTQFDKHAASTEHPMKVEAGRRLGRATITSSTPAVSKLGKTRKTGSQGAEEAKDAPPATITFEAPCHVNWTRRTPDGKASSYIAFWAVPTGLGRCRFMTRSAATPKGAKLGKLLMRRWLFSMFLNSFLDQDSFLVASQQKHVLAEEAQVLREQLAKEHDSKGSGDGSGSDKAVAPLRRRVFNYRAPSDALLALLGRWEDAAVPRIPNRNDALLSYDTGDGILQPLERKVVLDRWTQHTLITPESLTAHNRAAVIRNVCIALSALAAGFATAQLYWPLGVASAGLAVVAAVCNRLVAAFHYVYDEKASQKDLARIAPLTAHLQASPALHTH